MNSGASALGVPKLKSLPGPSPWQKFNMVIGAVTTAPVKATVLVEDKAWWRQNGENMEIVYNYRSTVATGATTGTGTYLFPIPGGYHIDTTILALTFGGLGGGCGSGASSGASANALVLPVAFNSTNLALLASTANFIGSTYNTLSGQNAIEFGFVASVPIVEFRA